MKRFIGAKPTRLIGDKAYDSDRLDALLKAEGVGLIAPHKKHLKKPLHRTAKS